MTDLPATTQAGHPEAGAAAKARRYLAAAAGPENTKRAYRADWTDFTAWCQTRGRLVLPVDPATVALHLADRAGELARPLDVGAAGQRAPGCSSSNRPPVW